MVVVEWRVRPHAVLLHILLFQLFYILLGVLVSVRAKLSSCSLGGSIWLLTKKWERAGFLAVSGFGLKREKGSEGATSAVCLFLGGWLLVVTLASSIELESVCGEL